MSDGKEIQKDFIINPEKPIPESSTNIHKITDCIVKDKKIFEYHSEEISQDFKEADIIIGYNIMSFDLPLLWREF